MPDSVDVLFLVPPMKPVPRPIDIIYTLIFRLKDLKDLTPLQLGLLSMAAYLREEGFSCQYHDLAHFEGAPSLHETLSNLLKTYNPSIVGLTSYTPNFNATLKTIAIIKDLNPNILICVGGPHVTFLDTYSLEESGDAIDVVVRGEGEKTMRDIAYHYLKGHPLEENVRGITTKKKRTTDQVLLTNEELEALPPMALELIPKQERKNIIYLPLNATRGCPYKCTFCVNPPFWQHKIRFRPPDKVINEIKIAQELFPEMLIEFTDTILPYRTAHFENLVNQYKELIDLPVMMALTRANLTDDKRLQLMKSLLGEEGYLTIGLENGNQRVLEIMKKPSWDEQLQALKNIKRFRITSIPSWMVGFCGENLSTWIENMKKLNYLNEKQLINSTILFTWIPIPGSLPFESPKKFGVRIHNLNWDFYDRAVFPPPYSLISPSTGETVLSNLQIWAYYLSMYTLQKTWSIRKDPLKGKSISPEEFLKMCLKNPPFMYFSPVNESDINLYEDLFA